MPNISVIILNYNTSVLTLNCISSIKKQTNENESYEIIVVDNASNYTDYQTLKKSEIINKNNNILLLRQRKNLGFAGGNMVGVNHAKGEYLAFINSDVLLKNDCLNILRSFLDSSGAAVAGAAQFDSDGNYVASHDYFLSIKREILGRDIFRLMNPMRYQNRKNQVKAAVKVDSIPGSLMFIRAHSFNQVGGFDTNLFLYFEETDLCYRISKTVSSGSTYHVPQAQYTHLSGSSTNPNLLIDRELKLSKIYVLRKHSNIILFALYYVLLVLKTIIKSIFSSKNRFLLKFYLQGSPLHHSLKQNQNIHDY